jgi:hypothetical protein
MVFSREDADVSQGVLRDQLWAMEMMERSKYSVATRCFLAASFLDAIGSLRYQIKRHEDCI